MSELRERLTAVETLVGEDTKSGLRGEVSDLHEKFDRIIERIGASEKRMAMLIGGIIVISRAAELFLK